MTKQRRTEKFNLNLAKYLLQNNVITNEEDRRKLESVIGRSWNLMPIYKQGGENLDGRNWCEKGLCMFSRKLRNTLSYQHYLDIDMMNASYTWLRMILKKNDMKVPLVEDYCENREKILADYMEKNNCDRDEAKKYFTKKIFACKDNFLQELADKYKGTSVYELFKKAEEYNHRGKYLCHIYAQWEWDTLSKIMELFEKMKVKCYADLHDGFFVDKFVNPCVLEEAIKKVKDKWGVDMKIKEMTDFLDIPFEYIENFKKAMNLTDWQKYEEYRDMFEEEWRVYKVLDQDRYLLETDGGYTGYYLRTSACMTNMFCDWNKAGAETFNLFNDGGSGKRFIHNYLLDPDKRQVKTIDFYPNPDKCPDYVYNLFTGFHINTINDEFSEKDYKDFEMIKGHIRVLVDDGQGDIDEYFNYLVDWLAHLFQYPEEKTLTMIILKGGEGTGKSLLFQQIGYMLGDKYTFTTANAVRDLFGNFNSVGKNKLLVNIDEVEMSQTEKVYEQLKQLITRNTAFINEKHEKPMHINDYSRYLMTTNNECVLKISDTNRRFVAFESIHPARKDIDEVKDAFFNDKALKLLYNYLMSRDISTRIWKNFPKTRYYMRCLESSISTTWKFINNLFSSPITFENYPKNNFTHKIRKCEMRAQYEQFCYTNKLTAIRMNVFDAELEATYLFMQKRTSTVRLWVFNMNSVIEKLKKMGLFEQQNFLEDDE